MMVDFTLLGSAEPVDLGEGYSVEAGLITGKVSTSPRRLLGTRAVGDELDTLLERAV